MRGRVLRVHWVVICNRTLRNHCSTQSVTLPLRHSLQGFPTRPQLTPPDRLPPLLSLPGLRPTAATPENSGDPTHPDHTVTCLAIWKRWTRVAIPRPPPSRFGHFRPSIRGTLPTNKCRLVLSRGGDVYHVQFRHDHEIRLGGCEKLSQRSAESVSPPFLQTSHGVGSLASTISYRSVNPLHRQSAQILD